MSTYDDDAYLFDLLEALYGPDVYAYPEFEPPYSADGEPYPLHVPRRADGMFIALDLDDPESPLSYDEACEESDWKPARLDGDDGSRGAEPEAASCGPSGPSPRRSAQAVARWNGWIVSVSKPGTTTGDVPGR